MHNVHNVAYWYLIYRSVVYSIGLFATRLRCANLYPSYIKMCPRGTQTCALLLFCHRDLEIDPLTLKLKGDLYILQMYPYTENEAASLMYRSVS